MTRGPARPPASPHPPGRPSLPQILVYDSRGIGRSSCPPGPQTTRLLAADALAVVDAVLGRDAEFYLLGASLGGMVAQELLHGLVAAGRQ